MAPAIKYVGRATYFQGKRLFDILCRLKNFGLGRIVYRNHEIESYPELSYYVITGVDPDMSDPTQADTDSWVRSYAYGRRVFRGEQLGETKISTSFKADWKLVPRSEEEKFTSFHVERKPRVFPTSVPFPPLLAHMLAAEKQKTGLPLKETPVLPLVFHKGTRSSLDTLVAKKASYDLNNHETRAGSK